MPPKFPFYALGFGLMLMASLMLVWLMGAVGVLAVEGDPADRMYLAVFAIGIYGALLARFKALGMSRAALAMALAIAGIAVIALAMGLHRSPISSIYEVVGVNGIFFVMYVVASWLFAQAARVRGLVDARLY